MLEAIRKNKAKHFLLGTTPPKKRPKEDLITDAVFGGLRYFDAADAATLLNFIFDQPQRDHKLPRFSSIDEVRLWYRWNNCEPDVIVTGKCSNSTSIELIIEVKFDDNLDAEQVEKQRKVFVSRAQTPPRQVFHVFVVRQALDVERSVRVRSSGTVVLWQSILHGLISSKALTSTVLKTHQSNWVDGVTELLKFILGPTFSGKWDEIVEDFILLRPPTTTVRRPYLFFDKDDVHTLEDDAK